MDGRESTSLLIGNPAHAKYKPSLLVKDLFLRRLTTFRRVSAVRCVFWGMWLALGCLQRFARGLSLVFWPNEGNQSPWLGSCCPWSRTTGLAASRRGHSRLPDLPAPDRELHPPGVGPCPRLHDVKPYGGKDSSLLKVEEGAALFLPSLPFPSWMHPAILGMSGMRLACDFNKTYLITFILITEYFQIFLHLISSP